MNPEPSNTSPSKRSPVNAPLPQTEEDMRRPNQEHEEEEEEHDEAEPYSDSDSTSNNAQGGQKLLSHRGRVRNGPGYDSGAFSKQKKSRFLAPNSPQANPNLATRTLWVYLPANS